MDTRPLKLDYNPATNMFFLRIPRKGNDIQAFIKDHGFDLSLPASTPQEAVLFTDEPYAAAPFGEYATPAAKHSLRYILSEIEKSRLPGVDANYACPPDRELWPFQKADISYALSRKHTLVGDQPGLGKTPIAICFANEIKAKKILVVCPASIRLQWARRIRDWTTIPWPCKIHTILNAKYGVHPNAAYTIVSYELAANDALNRALSRERFDLLILDEAHYLKTPSAKRTRAIFGGGNSIAIAGLASRSERVLALSGTPLPNRPREAFAISRGLCHDAIDWQTEDEFQDRFNPTERKEIVDKEGNKKWVVDERSGRHAELQARMRGNFMTRHLKRDVMDQLKMPKYDLIQVSETGSVKQALDAESLLHIDPEDLTGANAATLGHIAVVRKMMGLALAPQVCEYIDMLIDGGEEKILLFGWHIEVLDIFEAQLAKHGLVRVDGRTSTVAKEARVNKFITDPNVRVIIGNLLSLGTGTDGLQGVCSHALIAEPDWTPGNNIQGFDRLDRGGQTRTVQGDIFVAPGSFAEKILGSALRKLQTVDKALDRRM